MLFSEYEYENEYISSFLFAVLSFCAITTNVEMQVTLIGKLLQEFRISYIRLKLVTWPLFLAKIRGMVYRFKCLERMIKLITFYIICALMNSKRGGAKLVKSARRGTQPPVDQMT